MVKKKKDVSGIINKRYDMLVAYSIDMDNPNGDSDSGMPRMINDMGVMSPASMKHKSREYLAQYYGDQPGYQVLYQEGNIRDQYFKKVENKVKGKGDKVDIRTAICAECVDVRLFGSVVTGANSNAPIHGPVQFGWAKSVGPIDPISEGITCSAPAKRKKGKGDDEEGAVTGRMGTTWIVPFGFYVAPIHISPSHAGRPRNPAANLKDEDLNYSEFQGTGMTHRDLALFFESIFYGPECTRSAGRTGLTVEHLYVFEHKNARGNAQATKLFRNHLVFDVEEGIDIPRGVDDILHQVTNLDDLPSGVTLWEVSLADNGEVMWDSIS